MEEVTGDVFNPEEMAEKAIRESGLEDHYDENTIYHNPAKNAKFGMSFNWHNNLVPDNVVDLICSHETLPAGVARAADMTLHNTVTHRYFDDVTYYIDDKKDWRIGIIQELVRRDGKGAFGEMWAKRNVDIPGKVISTVPSDENKGIDIRTTEDNYQVKTGEKFKSGWEKKEADHLIWVKMDGNKVTGYEMK